MQLADKIAMEIQRKISLKENNQCTLSHIAFYFRALQVKLFFNDLDDEPETFFSSTVGGIYLKNVINQVFYELKEKNKSIVDS